MKLSDYKNDAALDLVADLIEPIAEIVGDKAFLNAFKEDKKSRAVALTIRNHKDSIVEIMARIDGIPVKDYHFNAFTLPVKVLEFFNDPELQQVFISAGLMNGAKSSISPMVNTEADEQ